MKKFCLACCLGLVFVFSACAEGGNTFLPIIDPNGDAQGQKNDREVKTGRENGEETEERMPEREAEEKESEEKVDVPEESESEHDARMAAFASVLRGIYFDHVLPENQQMDFDGTFMDITENRFAICDIDQDGREELIFEFTTSSMAGMMEIIYDYDENLKAAWEEFAEFPAMTFYDNGIIEAKWSHNQGLAGDFWPYTFYRHERVSDSYQAVGMADAWDKSLAEEDYEGNLFPDETDADGDGMVYYVMQYGVYSTEEPVDGAVYQAWRDSYLAGAKAIDVPFVNLTEENIGRIR